MENMSFQDWCAQEIENGRRTRFEPADELLETDLIGYERYLEASGSAEQLRVFRARRQELIPMVPGAVSPSGRRGGAVHGSFAHFTTFIEACRRHEGAQALIEERGEVDFFTWVSGQDSDVPRWLQTSFKRSVVHHAEEVRRVFFGQPRIEERRELVFVPGEPMVANSPSALRSLPANPIPAQLEDMIGVLTDWIAGINIPAEEEVWNWLVQISVVAMLEMRESREPQDNAPVNFEYPPRVFPSLEEILEFYDENSRLHGLNNPPDSDVDSFDDRESESDFNDFGSSHLQNEVFDGDSDTLYDVWNPFRSVNPEPSQQEIRAHLWDAAEQEDILEEIRAALIELADQSDSEDEDRHARLNSDLQDIHGMSTKPLT